MANTAQWACTDSGKNYVKVMSGELNIANVHFTVKLGWRVYYNGTGRSNGRKYYATPDDALYAYFGKRIELEAK